MLTLGNASRSPLRYAALGLTEMAEGVFHDSRTGKNGWHGLTGQFRQSVFGRLGGYDDVNDADRPQQCRSAPASCAGI